MVLMAFVQLQEGASENGDCAKCMGSPFSDMPSAMCQQAVVSECVVGCPWLVLLCAGGR